MTWNIARIFRSLPAPKPRPRRPYRRAPLLWLERLEDRLAPAMVSWNADTSGDWSTGANWSSDNVPGPNDDVIINRLVPITVTIDAGDQSVHSLQSNANATIDLSAPSLTVAATSQIDGSFTVSGASVSGPLTSTGSLTWGGGSLSGLTNKGTLTIAASGYTGGLDNFGTIVETGAPLKIGAGATVTNEAGGLFDIQGSGAEVLGDINGDTPSPSTFINDGLLRRSVSSNTASLAPRLSNGGNGDLTFENDGGTIDVETGTLVLSPDSLTNTGSFTVASGAILDIMGTVNYQPILSGTFTATGGGSVQFIGDGSGSDGINANGATFDFPAGMATLASSSFIGGTNTGDLVWNSGALSGLTNKGTLTITCSFGNTGSLDNFGTIIETGNQLRINVGSTLTNEAGAVFDMQGDGVEIFGDINLNGGVGPSTFVNHGVLRRSTSSGTPAWRRASPAVAVIQTAISSSRTTAEPLMSRQGR